MELPKPLTDIPLSGLDEKGNAPECRLSDPVGLRTLWEKQRTADSQSSAMRARAQELFDGGPPFDQCALNKSGQGFKANFNPGDAKAALDSAVAAFHDLDAAEEKLAHLPTRHGNEYERAEWQEIMEEEFGKTIRDWGEYRFKNPYVAHHMRLHGVSVVYYGDCQNWQWDVSHLGDFKIPRQTPACEELIPYAIMRKEMAVNELWRHIKDKEAAKEEGWNCEATCLAIQKASSKGWATEDWEKTEARIKNNDIVAGAEAETVAVLHGWVREFDDTISFYICTEEAIGSNVSTTGNSDQFLYTERHRYKNAAQAYTLYCNGIGTNGTYHSISGIGKDMYNSYVALMRLMNRTYDIAFSSGPVFGAKTEEAIENLQMTPYAGFTVVSAGLEPMQLNPPSLANSVVPVMNDLRGSIQRTSGQYTADNIFGSGNEKTATEISAHLEHLAKLSITSISLWYTARDRHIQEVVRRFLRKDYQRSEPGGHYVHDFRLRCQQRGVPKEAIDKIDIQRVRAVRAIGGGSPAARRVALQALTGLMANYDPAGRQLLIRKLTASIAGSEIANELAPPPTADARPPKDKKIAEFENALLALGQPASIEPNEDMDVHLQVHIGRIGEFLQQFDEAGQNPEMFADIVPPLDAIYRHAAETLELYSENTHAPGVPQYRQMLQQAGEILLNGTRHLQKLAKQQAQQQEGQGGADAQQQQMTNEVERRTIEFQVRLQQMAMDGDQKRTERAKDAELERRLKDASTAAEIKRKNMLAEFNAISSRNKRPPAQDAAA